MDYEKIRSAWVKILIAVLIIGIICIFAFDSKMTTFYVLLVLFVIFMIEIILEIYQRKSVKNN